MSLINKNHFRIIGCISTKKITFVEQNLFIMKRIILILSLIAIVSLNCKAQAGKTNFGIKIGPSLCWANSVNTYGKGDGSQLGLSFGGFVDEYFTENVGVSIGLNFYLMQMKYQFTDYRLVPNFLVEDDVLVNRSFKGTYLELPFMFKAKFSIADSWNLYGQAGAGLAVNLSARCKDSFDFYGIPIEDPEYTNHILEYRALQASLHAGLGVEYELSSTLNLFVQLSYRHSFSNMFTKQMYDKTNSNLKANHLALELGVLF